MTILGSRGQYSISGKYLYSVLKLRGSAARQYDGVVCRLMAVKKNALEQNLRIITKIIFRFSTPYSFKIKSEILFSSKIGFFVISSISSLVTSCGSKSIWFNFRKLSFVCRDFKFSTFPCFKNGGVREHAFFQIDGFTFRNMPNISISTFRAAWFGGIWPSRNSFLSFSWSLGIREIRGSCVIAVCLQYFITDRFDHLWQKWWHFRSLTYFRPLTILGLTGW